MAKAPSASAARPGIDRTPTAASVLALLDGIERHGPRAPAAIAFRSALKRKGADAFETGGSSAVSDLLRQVAEVDPERAQARAAIMQDAWVSLGLSTTEPFPANAKQRSV